MAAPVLHIKRGAYTNLPGLRAGEPGFTTDKYDLYVGLTGNLVDNKFFGSHRYWTREDGVNSLKFKLVDKDGTNSISLKSPNTVSSDVTYTLPSSPIDGYVLSTNSSGILSWTNSFSNLILSGIATFTDTTDNTLGNADTGSVQIDGGLGVNKNVTVGANLHVEGSSNFVGVVTFRGGTINLGDGNTDNINVGGEFVSNLTPNDDDTYDIGIGNQRWRNANFSGIGTFATGAVVDAVRIGLTASNEIDTSSGNLILDSANGTTEIQDNLTVSGDVRINGGDILASDGNVNITLTSNTLTTFAGDIEVIGNTIKSSTGNAIELSGSDVSIYGDLQIVGDSIKSSTSDVAIQLSGTDVEIIGDLQITGNDLKVSGGTTAISFNGVDAEIKGDLTVSGNDIKSSGGTIALTLTGADVEIKGDLQVSGNDIKSSNGTTVLTLSTSGAVTAASDLTVSGNLFVNGSTTQVNTASLLVEDRTIDLGIVNGSAPTSATTWDLGVLFNYHSGGTAKKSAVVWEHGDSRFKFASILNGDGEGSDSNSPQLTVSTFAPIEIAELWVNNSCTGGSSQVISCVNSELQLQNITVDAGTF